MPFVNRLLLAVILSVVLQCLMVNADPKVVHMISLYQGDYNSFNKIVTLEYEELVHKSSWMVELGPPNQEGLIPIGMNENKVDWEGHHFQCRTDEVPIVGKGVG
uniref:Uncharacterized protein n=1 Tax=Bactrocera dorsalis TaxID=27457 RepID=A0A034VTV3_BACDO